MMSKPRRVVAWQINYNMLKLMKPSNLLMEKNKSLSKSIFMMMIVMSQIKISTFN